ncbi:uncharacterized protein Dwil_GK19988 [Drosophila willistoni]|uniref:Uncharacterized protein n=1 Tax=Drosophila willistoni TaxID=7260 RepID=B4MSK0_DROWI|nr:uncharacterized protein LOC6641452 [Drosophila willistoni]EDW75089.2 uncharacterized protein Dwil_GK19988 [Drosophila willistoni]
MHLYKFLLISLLAMVSVQGLLAACVCSEKGSDYCQSCQGATVVRPKPRYYESSPDVNLSPIGDNCWCSKQLIEPAQLPKTCGKKTPCKPTCGCQQSDDSSSNYGNIVYSKTTQEDSSSAADPISVGLAVQAGKAINVPEAKLAYGFAQKPVDGIQKVYFSNVPEENLFKLKSDVITLKKRTYSKQTDEEEYEAEQEEEETTSDDDDEAAPQLTYKQLGYITEQYKDPKFKKIKSSYSSRSSYSSSSSDGYGKVAGKVSVDCGFKPGRVTSYRNANRQEPDAGNCY